MEYILFSTMVRKLTVFFVLGFFANIGFGQCSDAGICTLSGMKHLEKNEVGLVGLNYVSGKSPSTYSMTFHSIRFISEREFIENFEVKILIPFNVQSGPLGNVAGIGDLMLSLQLTLTNVYDASLVLEGGMKFATAKQNVDSLPQRYQSGLGTNDILLNATYSKGGFHVGVGIQQPLDRSSNYEQLKRGRDIAVRVGYEKTFDAFGLNVALVAVTGNGQSIKHVSSPPMPTTTPYEAVPNSDQFQVNLAVDAKYVLSERMSLTLGAALPFLKREVNIDGLSRSFTLSAGLYVTY
jgi:hypothetical protein